MIEVENLRVAYGPVVAVHDISLKVPPNSIISLIGSNGAGKSSTVKAIAGLVRPQSGRVTIDGRQMQGKSAFRIAKLNLRLVPEGGGVFSRMTVEENLLTGLGWGRSGKEELASVYERFPVLAERSRQWGGSLSGGERQMLALGRALMSRPRYILLDEPSLGLAPKIIDEVFAMIVQLRAEGLGILLIEQNATRALEVADYAYTLELGAISLEGEGKALRANPAIIDRYLGGA
jgi:branched-chain amino acid transport system ATP-binding protein